MARNNNSLLHPPSKAFSQHFATSCHYCAPPSIFWVFTVLRNNFATRERGGVLAVFEFFLVSFLALLAFFWALPFGFLGFFGFFGFLFGFY